MRSPKLSGLAVTMIGAGLVVGYAGIKNATVVDTLRSLIKGRAVTGSSSGSVGEAIGQAGADLAKVVGASAAAAGASSGGSSGGGGPQQAPQEGTDYGFKVAEQAQKYIGVPYKFGGSSPSGMDCSGLVNYVIGHDLHGAIPGSPSGSYSGHGPTSTTWYAWPGAVTIPRAQCAPGDLVCWIGHIGIAISNDQMISAPGVGHPVHQTGWSDTIAPPIIRRLK